MRERQGWVKGMLTGIPNSTQPPPNIVQLPAKGFDELAWAHQEAVNKTVHWEAEAARVELGYNEAYHQLLKIEKKWNDRCKDVLGSRNEFPERGGPIQGDVDAKRSVPDDDP